MLFRYNYNFLLQWMKVNKKTKKDVLNALGTQDYPSIKKWVEGTVPMHIEAILRLCNTFNISLGAFFYDEDQIKKMPNSEVLLEQLQPQRTKTDKSNKNGKGKITGDPIIEKKTTIIPPFVDTICVKSTNTSLASIQLANASPTVLGGNLSPQTFAESLILKTQLQYERQIRELETKHKEQEDKIRQECQAHFDAERKRLFDFIDKIVQNTLSKESE